MSANVLVIGNGGREHAIVWKLSQSPTVKNIFIAPGSDGIQTVEKAKIVKLEIKNHQEIVAWCQSNSVNLVVVGPEQPLENGIADALIKKDIPVFGPTKEGARIETDKNWAKHFMDRHSIPTARWKSFSNAQKAKEFIKSANFPALVVKASGLAGGKGVVVASNIDEACGAVDEIITAKKFGEAGDTVVIEELLQGEEVSVLAFSDGVTIKPMLPAQDHKRLLDNDEGPNTGGMGAYCPCPLVDSTDLEHIKANVLQRAIDGLSKENIKFVGVLYAGLMLTEDGPKVLEFNCRFGDPETEVILPLLETDLFTIMKACCNRELVNIQLNWKENLTAVGIVMASKDYPRSSSKDQIIKGIHVACKIPNCTVFHCGTAIKSGTVVTNGGRVLIAVTLSTELSTAAARALLACNIITFEGKQFRRDIAHKGIARSILKHGSLTYKKSGVDIATGNAVVENIKPLTKSTIREGVVGGIGNFGGLFDVKVTKFLDPILVSGTDGVGTKLKIAQEMGIHNTIGIDLVAMCVNDVLAHGAEPLFFLDYFACGKLQAGRIQQVLEGITEGCKQAGCALLGGETAEMPNMYSGEDYDLAGFTVGAVERSNMLPKTKDMSEGDVVIGLPSSGIHSNGFSLVRKIVSTAGVNYKDTAPFSKENKTYGEEFLTPTKIYIKQVLPFMNKGKIKAFAHITGGGLIENIPRILPQNLKVEIDAYKWRILPVFGWLATVGNVNEEEMLRTFNCGIGAVLIVDKKFAGSVVSSLSDYGAVNIGKLLTREANSGGVVVRNFTKAMEKMMRPHVPSLVLKNSLSKKRVGVLISGSGTNLQALIDATLDPTQHMGAEIVLVVSNKPNVEGLLRAKRANIPTKVILTKAYPSREEFDRAVHKELISAGVDIVCLAGFMRILSAEFTRNWKGRIINVHPALLPLFKGTHAQRQALEAGVRVSGCTVHFVEVGVDSGAIIVQEAVQIGSDETEESLIEKIKTVEHKAFPKALRLLATEKIKLVDNKIVWS